VNSNSSFSVTSENVAKDTNFVSVENKYIDRKFENTIDINGRKDSGGNITDTNKSDDNTFSLKVDPSELVLTPPKITPFKEYSKAIQKWEGTVISLVDDTFKAVLRPITGDNIEQEAEIYIEDITPNERTLIEPGSIFYWSIGYLESPSGRKRESIIRFRRLPPWTENENKKPPRDLKVYFDEIVNDR
jgi:hypothetical protein